MSLELLSPAGDFNSLKMAVSHGADAVYFGAKNFNARAKAAGFGDDLKDAVALCHMYGAKAYLTLNTLVENTEVQDLVLLIKNALECGIDAFIVQDFGVLYILKNCFDNVEIHTSTQMAVNNYLGAIMAKKFGAKRVVLSRETNLLDIKKIKDATGLDIEFFIQGALCVSFSGNCYLSSCMFGKSGNKGECLQPCRLPISAYSGKTKVAQGYLLSAKDICLAHKLKELKNAGVNSFKIEGRLRREAYVAGVTQTYRKIIDGDFKVTQEDEDNLKKCFNRGNYTQGYFNGNGQIIYPQTQGHMGINIGEVQKVKIGNRFNTITIRSVHKINKGDVLKLIGQKQEIVLTAMDISTNGNLYNITTTQNAYAGQLVYLISDKTYEDQLLRHTKKLPVNFNMIANVGEPLILQYEFNKLKGQVQGSTCEAAQSAPLDESSAKNQLEKLGDTNFYLNDFTLNTNGVFVSKSELNKLRRDAVNSILRSFVSTKQVKVNNQPLTLEKVQNLPEKLSLEIGEIYSSGSDILVVKPSDYLSFDYSKINHNNVYLYIPPFLRSEDIEVIDKILHRYQFLGVYAENIGALNYQRKTILGAKLNIKNIYALKQLKSDYVTAVVASPELSDENYKVLQEYSSVPIFKSSFNNFDLMTLVSCPIKNVFSGSCKNCKYNSELTYKLDNGQSLGIKRYKVKNCYFNLVKKIDFNNKILYTTY